MARIQLKIWRAPFSILSQAAPVGLAEGEIGIASESNILYKRPDGDGTGALIPVDGGALHAKVVATSNVTLIGLQTIDGVVLATGDTVLVTGQSTPSQNGLYTAAASTWTRSPGADAWSMLTGVIFVVSEGAAYANSAWLCTSTADGVLDATAVTFSIVANHTIAALSTVAPAVNALPYFVSANEATSTPLTPFARTLLDDGDASTARLTLGAAPIASPALTGVPTAPTAAVGSNTAQLATTAFVQSALSSVATNGGSSSFLSLATTGPASIGGTLSVAGDLVISGTTTTVNSTTVTIDDPVFTLGGDGAPTVNDGKDRGIEFRWHNGTSAKTGFFGFDVSTGCFTFIPDAANASEVFSGVVGTIEANLEGNAATATKFATGRTLGMTGDVVWTSPSFDGSGNVTAAATLANSGVTAGTYRSVTVDAKGRVTSGTNPTTLSGYGIVDAAPLASPSLTGTPTAPTAAVGTNTTQLATTAFVQSAVAGLSGAGPSPIGSFTTLSVSGDATVGGNLTLSGAARRITGDFSNSTHAQRVMFQTSTTNATTAVSALPSGSGTGGSFTAFDKSDPENSAYAQMFVGSDVGMVGIRSGASGAGTPLPLKFLTGAAGLERVVIEASGSTQFKGGVFGQRVKLSGSSDLDLSLGNFFLAEVTNAVSFTVSNVPSDGVTASFVLELIDGGSFAVTWWTGTYGAPVQWADGVAPTLTVASRDILGFFTNDGGVTWTGMVLSKNVH